MIDIFKFFKTPLEVRKLREENDNLRELIRDCYYDITSGDYWARGAYKPDSQMEHVGYKLRGWVKLYKRAQWEIEKIRMYERQINEMQAKIDEQAEYICKMQKAYYVSNEAMEADECMQE